MNDVLSGKWLVWFGCNRKYLGIAAGVFSLIHVFIFTFGLGADFWVKNIFSFDSLFGWGILAMIFIIPPLLTSNVTAQKYLKKNWKVVQRLSYLAFVFAGIHIIFVGGFWWQGALPLIIWVIFYIWSELKIRRNRENFLLKVK